MPSHEKNKKLLLIPAGTVFTISTGVYSDYIIQGVFRALKLIDANQLKVSWVEAHPDQTGHYDFNESSFIGMLAKEGYMEDIPSMEFHICDYGDVEEMNVYPISQKTEDNFEGDL